MTSGETGERKGSRSKNGARLKIPAKQGWRTVLWVGLLCVWVFCFFLFTFIFNVFFPLPF